MIGEILLLILSGLFLLFVFNKHQKPNGLPPGEWGLPIVGYVPWMSGKLTNRLEVLQKKYGDIFSLKLGTHIFIVLTDYNLIKTAFNRPEIQGRPDFFSFRIFKENNKLGLVTSDEKEWATNRRFAIRTLKDFGFGKSKMEDSILTEAEFLIQDFRKNLGKPIEIQWNVNVAILNVIWRLVADRRYDIEDEEIHEFNQIVSENIEDTDGPMTILDFFPYLIPFVPNFVKNSFLRVQNVENRRTKLYDLFTKLVNEHKESLDTNNARDYIDKYLIEMENQKNDPHYAHWGHSDLMVELFDLFSAGSETTSSTLRWFFLYMAKYPETQKRVQEEIDRVLPRYQLPSLRDKQNLPSLEALSLEIGRVITFVPTLVPHRVTQDTTLGGFQIPKESLVICNVESVHKDPRFWKFPNDLSLENFLDPEGKFVNQTEGYMPFSIGKRLCVGESLAKTELFLFMGAILQNFVISEPEGQNASLIPDQTVNIINVPEKFKVVLTNRV